VGDNSDGSEESDEAEGEWDGDGDEEDENGDNSHLCMYMIHVSQFSKESLD
jgi:hypothetical protein